MKELTPSYAELDEIKSSLDIKGFCIFDTTRVIQWTGCSKEELDDLSTAWNNLPEDKYLKDKGQYRHRRHSNFVFKNNILTQVPHRAHWQPIEYNALHGGMERWFEPVLESTLNKPAWTKILSKFACDINDLHGNLDTNWCIEAHQFRIDTSDGIGRPTPEGAHRDGVDFVAVFMVNRNNIKGGETRIFEANGPRGERFTLNEPWTVLILDDSKVIHESTPIQPLTNKGYRDTLVVTLRKNYFQNMIV
jgi:hypothetical protein